VPPLELLELEPDEELLLELELLPPELLLEPPDLLEALVLETLLAPALSVSAEEPPPHPAKTAVARQAATIVVFFKQRFAMSTNISTGMITLCPSGESIATRRHSATVAECRISRRLPTWKAGAGAACRRARSPLGARSRRRSPATHAHR